MGAWQKDSADWLRASRMEADGRCKVAATWPQTPSSGEVIIDVRTTKAPAGTGSPLDLPVAKGLTPEQQQWFRELIRRWAWVLVVHEEDFGKTDTVLHNISTGEAPPSWERYRPLLAFSPSCSPCYRRRYRVG
ncbi:hypothetical protein SKAU_G00234350 [Synaphobranchus kaupii]|uniref:Uncharacterized protein n=1 Tax=Synaphobranchus kaupii TaxID=118154 RepID=A0A9Q1F6P7_SYNKA|nr:hypothetical protein SKAU_G00234350 [Synaphobranchus kaupii]